LPADFFIEFLKSFFIFFFAFALQVRGISLNIKDSVDDAFEELLLLTVAAQVFAHAEEEVEPVFRQENASEE
jgi:hypothetical protein